MAKTKYIVPVVAMMLCVVSLIGAAYAAVSATLTDNETVDAKNKYVELTLGSRSVEENIILEWDYEITYTNGSSGTPTWTLVEGQKKLVMSFSIAKESIQNATSETYSLEATLTSLANVSAGASLNVYTNEACSSAATASSLSYGTTYYLALEYSTGAPAVHVAPGATSAMVFTLEATANITA